MSSLNLRISNKTNIYLMTTVSLNGKLKSNKEAVRLGRNEIRLEFLDIKLKNTIYKLLT